MKTTIRLLKKHWKAGLTGIFLLFFFVFPALRLGFSTLGRALSPGEQTKPVYQLWPRDGEIVSTLTPTLRWPAPPDGNFLVELTGVRADGGVTGYSIQSTSPRLKVSPGLLEEGGDYCWSVLEVSQDIPEPLAQGCFETQLSLVQGPMRISPSVLSLGPTELSSGIALRVQVPRGTEVRVLLPGFLTSDGKRKVLTTGSVTLPLRFTPAVSSLSPDNEGILGHVLVSVDSNVHRLPVRFDSSTMGNWMRNIESGLNPILDTPNFPNFSQGLLARYTRGTCLGMVLSVSNNFQRCEDCSEGRCSCVPMRMRSLLHPNAVKEEMNFLHMANLDPSNWNGAVFSILGTGEHLEMASRILVRLSKGETVPLAVLPGEEKKEPNVGHAVLVYGAQEFHDLFLFHVYDPDMIYENNGPPGTFIVVEKDPAAHPAATYHNFAGIDSVKIFPLSPSPVLGTLAGVVSGPFNAMDSGIINWIDQ